MAAAMRGVPSGPDELAARLERGWRVIDEAERAGDATTAERLFRHWKRLLAEYEAAGSSGQRPRPGRTAREAGA